MIQTKNRGKYRILPGNPEKMGASATKDGYNFAVEVSDGKKAELLLYRKGHQKPFLTVPLPEEKRWDGLTVLSIAPLLASAIRAVFEDGSVAELFDTYPEHHGQGFLFA